MRKKDEKITHYTSLPNEESFIEYINKVWDNAGNKIEKIHPHILETKEEFLKQTK
jgi:hypothetical protein